MNNSTPPSTIVVQVRSSDNYIMTSIHFDYSNEQALLAALHLAVPQLAVHGVMEVENNELHQFKFGQIKVKSNANLQRAERFHKTGN